MAFLLAAGLTIPAIAGAGVDYLAEIKPLLKRKCYACHGALKQKAGLQSQVRAMTKELETVRLVQAQWQPVDGDGGEIAHETEDNLYHLCKQVCLVHGSPHSKSHSLACNCRVFASHAFCTAP